MALNTDLTKRLGILHPIIQAPMAGGPTTVDLVVAVCEAGGMGSLAGAYTTPQKIVEWGHEVKNRISRPFGINLFAPLPPPELPPDPDVALKAVAPFYEELGLPAPTLPSIERDSFDEQLAAALECGASVFSFTFGTLPSSAVEAIKSRGIFLMGTATKVEEAVQLERSGVDAVIAQGGEAGAHRGTFVGDFESAMIGTMALVPQIVSAVRVPVIAAGGIMDGRGVAAALALGAGAAQMGTAFLTCNEAGTSETYKEAILHAREDRTRVTRAFTGRPARGIVNRFMDGVERQGTADAILPFPIQNSLTRPLRQAAAKQNNSEYLSLWAGQGVRLARRQSAGDLVRRLASEGEAEIRRLASLLGK